MFVSNKNGTHSKLAAGMLALGTVASAAYAGGVQRHDSLDLAIEAALGETHYDAIWQVGTELEGVESAWQAPNRAEDLRTYFLRDGVRIVPRSGGAREWDLSMGLRGLRRGDARRAVGAAEVHADGQRVELRRDGVVEWYRNDDRGLEQGFDLANRFAADEAGELELLVDIGGELTLCEVAGARVTFTDEHGEHTLTMDGLATFDAEGRRLPSRFERRGEELAILVDDRGAAYPITVDPLVTNEVAKLEVDDQVPGAKLGTSMDQLSSRVVVGAPGTSTAYLFKLVGGSWEIEAKLSHSSIDPTDEFGCDVALSGAAIAVGARLDDDAAANSGAIHTYRQNGSGTWVYDQKVTSPWAQPAEHFGESCDITGDWMIVGSPQQDSPEIDGGAVIAWFRAGSGWEFAERYTPNIPQANARMGASLDFDGLNFAVGAPGSVAGGQTTGAVHVYEFSGGSFPLWDRVQSVYPFGGADAGASVDLTGNFLAFGSPRADAGGVDRGMVWVMERNGSTYGALGALSGETNGDAFGASVSIHGNHAQGLRLLVGAPKREVGGQTDAGAAYMMLHQSSTLWTLEDRIEPEAVPFANFGSAVHLIGTTAFVGGPGDTNDHNTRCGSTRVFARTGSQWDETQALRTRDRDAQDQTGYAVAIDGAHAIVGTPGDDDMGPGAGAAYLFRQEGGQWRAFSKLTAGNDASAFDAFGGAVDISGGTAVVGARHDESLNGTPCGAAFVFADNGAGGWAEVSRLVPTVPVNQAYFGEAVAIDGDLIAVGAWNDAGIAGNSGAVYVYRKGAFWAFEQKLSLGQDFSSFGDSVSVSNGLIAVGSPTADPLGNDTGEVRVLERVGGDWIIRDYLTLSLESADTLFGKAVALDGDRLVVGAPGDLAGKGLAHLYTRTGGHFGAPVTLTAANGSVAALFGEAVALDGDVIAIGAKKGDDAAANGGAVHVWQLAGQDWIETDTLLGSDTDSNDWLGASVAVQGRRVLAGAPSHDAPGLPNVGAAYLFEVDEPSPYQPFALGDGSGAACPCNNESVAGSGQGCSNSTGQGAKLAGFGSTSIAANDMLLAATNLPANQNALLFMGSRKQLGTPFGDGLLGISGFMVRLQIEQAGPAGQARWDGLNGMGIWDAGDTVYFQVWYRDPFSGGGPCGSAFNLSNGLGVTVEQ